MKVLKRFIASAMIALGIASLAACGGGGGGSQLPPSSGSGPTLGAAITSPTVSYTFGWAQTVPLKSDATGTETPGVFPGQANMWDLQMDFSLGEGGNSQFAFPGALAMEVQTNGGSALFPFDQNYSELVFMTPFMTAGDGVTVAAVSKGADLSAGKGALAGTYSGYLNATADSRLTQSLVLAGATGTITASWKDSVETCDGSLFNINGYTPGYRVVVRNAAGTILQTLYSVSSATSTGSTIHSVDLLPSLAGQTVTLSFEENSMEESSADCLSIVDDVSVKDGAAHEYVQNGNFETGDMSHWSAKSPSVSQNVTSGARTVQG